MLVNEGSNDLQIMIYNIPKNWNENKSISPPLQYGKETDVGPTSGH